MRYWLIFVSHQNNSLSGFVGRFRRCENKILRLVQHFLYLTEPLNCSFSLATIFSFIGDTWCLIKFLAILKFLINGAQSSPILFRSVPTNAEEESNFFRHLKTFWQPFLSTNLFRWRTTEKDDEVIRNVTLRLNNTSIIIAPSRPFPERVFFDFARNIKTKHQLQMLERSFLLYLWSPKCQLLYLIPQKFFYSQASNKTHFGNVWPITSLFHTVAIIDDEHGLKELKQIICNHCDC